MDLEELNKKHSIGVYICKFVYHEVLLKVLAMLDYKSDDVHVLE